MGKLFSESETKYFVLQVLQANCPWRISRACQHVTNRMTHLVIYNGRGKMVNTRQMYVVCPLALLVWRHCRCHRRRHRRRLPEPSALRCVCVYEWCGIFYCSCHKSHVANCCASTRAIMRNILNATGVLVCEKERGR